MENWEKELIETLNTALSEVKETTIVVNGITKKVSKEEYIQIMIDRHKQAKAKFLARKTAVKQNVGKQQ